MSERFTPRLGIVLMTIVAFMKESDDSLLLGADSQFTSNGYRDFGIKLREVKNQYIAWASEGNPHIGLEEFGEWVDGYNFTDKNWGMFIDEATTQLSELNGRRKSNAEKAGYEYKRDSMGAGILIVGWLAGKARAYELTNDGGCFTILDFTKGIGVGGKSFRVAIAVIQRLYDIFDNLAAFYIALESTASYIEDCSPPIAIWRIKKDCIEKDIVEKIKTKQIGVSKKQFHELLNKASQPIKKSEKGKS
ncbi:hypothetical protein ACFLT8_04265 [Chloroflexota bacterium]